MRLAELMVSTHSGTQNVDAVQGAGDRATHAGDGVVIASVVGSAKDRFFVVAAGQHQEAERDGHFFDGMFTAGIPIVAAVAAVGLGIIGRGVVFAHDIAQGCDGAAPVAQRAGFFGDGGDAVSGAVFGDRQRGIDYGADRGIRLEGFGDASRHHRSGFETKAVLMGAEDIDRFG